MNSLNVTVVIPDGAGVVEVATDNVKSMDILVECAMIAMKQYEPELSEDRDKFEDVVDIRMIYKIIEVASGIKLDAEGNDLTAMGQPGTN